MKIDIDLELSGCKSDMERYGKMVKVIDSLNPQSDEDKLILKILRQTYIELIAYSFNNETEVLRSQWIDSASDLKERWQSFLSERYTEQLKQREHDELVTKWRRLVEEPDNDPLNLFIN